MANRQASWPLLGQFSASFCCWPLTKVVAFSGALRAVGGRSCQPFLRVSQGGDWTWIGRAATVPARPGREFRGDGVRYLSCRAPGFNWPGAMVNT
jgi:hypothetical protein